VPVAWTAAAFAPGIVILPCAVETPHDALPE
jgi:hypothetical protein